VTTFSHGLVLSRKSCIRSIIAEKEIQCVGWYSHCMKSTPNLSEEIDFKMLPCVGDQVCPVES